MKVKAKVHLHFPDYTIYRGQIGEVADEEFAKELIKRGSAEAVEAEKPKKEK